MTSEPVITILHLYPRELGINGDVGNVIALQKRAEWRGMPMQVLNHEVGGELPPAPHLVHIGSGPVSGQELVRDDLARIAPILREWAAAGIPFLAIAGGWQLLGRSLADQDGTVYEGAGVLPSAAALTSNRVVGEVAGTSSLGEIAGYENHGAVTTLLDGAGSLATVNGGRAEGVLAGSSIGTNLHGPFLPMNPLWADFLLKAAAGLAGVQFGADDANIATADSYASKSRDAVRSRL